MPALLARFSIGAKIGALAALLIALLAATGAIGALSMGWIGEELKGIAEEDIPLAKHATLAAQRQLEQAVAFERVVRIGEQDGAEAGGREAADFRDAKEQFQKLSLEAEAEIATAIKMLDELPERGSSKELGRIRQRFARAAQAHSAFARHGVEVIEAVGAGQLSDAAAAIGKIEAQEDALSLELEEIGRELRAFTAEAAISAEHHQQTGLLLIVGVFAASLIVGLGLAWALARAITRPLRKVIAALDALAAGDMSCEVTVTGRDEVAQLGLAYATFREKTIENERLRAERIEAEKRAEEEKRQAMLALADRFEQTVGGVVAGVRAASEQLTGASQSMAATAEETNRQAITVAAASEEASVNVQGVASASEQLSISIDEISRRVAQSSSIAGNASADAERTNAQVGRLCDAAQKIGDVVVLIQDIAAQTNLLALNATIEAVRAGEAGKGFAVVASEVKTLATQTAKATDEITQQIGAIQGETGGAADAIQGIARTISEISEIATGIASAVEEQNAATREISRNVQQAAQGTAEVSANITGVTEAAGETGAAAEQVNSLASALAEQSVQLREAVEAFLEGIRAA